MAVARVLVVGGGIAGTATALALALHKAGYDVTVYEAHPDSAEDIGAFLTLAGNGMCAVAQFDAATAVTALGFPLTSMRVLDATGAETAHVPLGDPDDPVLRYRYLRRGELNAALHAEATGRGIGVRHGVRLASVEDGPDGVTARFTDGSTARGDLLVGADGVHSTVRRAVAPIAQPVYAGQRVYYGYTGTAPVLGDTACIIMVRGSTAAFGHATSPTGQTYWFERVSSGEPLPAEEIARGTAAGRRDLLVPLLRKDPTPVADIVAATADELMVTNATELPPGTPWRSGRVLLVGDAAHAASPATGQGASMALEDAVVLAKCLRDVPDHTRALTLYESLRRPRTEHNTAVSGGISRGTHTSSPATRTSATGSGSPGDDELARLLDWNTPLRF
ncbi:FAD-dependent oxidoreductase [Streptomyces sp. NPDC056160]|uniref:FAD-dependent oxidoreductase n=1 Tax=Streptomyces sp. NPDC056160 TaxID=3345731 RepID=UPI0035D65F7C